MAADGKEKKKSDEEEWTEQVEPQSPKRKQSFEQGVRSGKRQRKAADTFAPSLYYAEPKQHRVRVVVGRGVKLFKIPEIRESIRSSSKDSLELKNAFKLLYRPPGKTPIPDMKQSLLDFSGYLPVFDGSEDQEKQEKMVEDAEAIVSHRAFKMKHQEVKKLCDFFHLDRSLKTTKEELIDVLLDFLGNPDVSHLKSNGHKKKNKSKTFSSRDEEVDDDDDASRDGEDKEEGEDTLQLKSKVQKKKNKTKTTVVDDDANRDGEEQEEDEDKNDEENYEEYTNDDGEFIAKGEHREVSVKALRRWVKAYVACFNMDKATIRHAIQTASDKFGVNLASKKEILKQLLTEEL